MEDEYWVLKSQLSKYYKGQTTAQEDQELMAALRNLPNSIFQQLLSELWEEEKSGDQLFDRRESELIFKSISDRLKPRKRFNWYVAAAALVGMMIGGFLYLDQNTGLMNSTKKETLVKQNIVPLVRPGENKAVFITSNGQVLNLKSLAKGESIAYEGNVVNKEKDGTITYQVAGDAGASKSETPWNTLKTPRGGQCPFRLPDGTRVWLNASSSISFPVDFCKANKKVKISGEVYFEVAKNADVPFQVITDETEIQVLGTSFNVSAYKEDNRVVTTLLEGSIKIKTGQDGTLLKPGQQASFSTTQQLSIKTLPDPNVTVAWKNGFFHFNDTDIEDIMRQVARWYDVSVTYNGKIPRKKLTGIISRNVALQQVLDILTYSGLHFNVQGKVITITAA